MDAHMAALEQVAVAGAAEGRVVAVGECGLDYDREEFCDRLQQRAAFEMQLRLAERTRLPMFLHNRATGGDFLALMREHRHRFTAGVVHSFTGSLEEALALSELGLHVGINGCSLKTEEGLAVVRALPADRIMLETDAPWCDIRRTHAGFSHVQTTWPEAKEPRKWAAGMVVKGRNEPCTMVQVLEVVAAVRGEDAGALAERVWRNTESVFWPVSDKGAGAAAAAAAASPSPDDGQRQ